ncbi:MAG: glutamine--fructose-6-phosphate transaminase (isomerizing) [Bacilli bacterium]|nr:glutamine--fructose-6-phosphate transaminase (isomerizing) [Bacilli bacterium]
MCGIIGYVGKKNNALDVIIEGLLRLEYRGYDSAGIAYVKDGLLNIEKEKGKIANLKEKLDFNDRSNLGIGHTRWATHGEPNYVNSHPHKVGKISIVHNGIIENYSELKEELIEKGYEFKSSTDTEVACALLDYIYSETNSIEQTIAIFKEKARGAYALGIIVDDDYNHLYAVKKDSPLIIACGDNENYIASDVPAILKYTNKYIVLNDGEFAKISADKILVYDENADLRKVEVKEFKGDSNAVEKNGYDHFMLKEIYEQPEVIKATTLPYIEKGIESLIDNMPDFSKYKKIDIVACGSAYHAGLVGKTLIEEFANIPVTVDIASEYRYKKLFLDEETLVIVVSQSGETADTLAALKIAKEHGSDTLGIINVVESSIARAAHQVLYTKAGAEIAVATTKAYSSQIALLSLIALNIANNKTMKQEEVLEVLKGIRALPTQMQSVLNEREHYKEIAEKIYDHDSIFFIGRDIDYALSMEGSLKLKEISYINSQAYAAGELKHGTISLIEEGTPVIALVTEEKIAEKTISNIKEVKARGAKVILVASENINISGDFYDELILVPDANKLIKPMLTVIPLQMLSYEIAKLRGCDIDKPKNLAKSVTVE